MGGDGRLRQFVRVPEGCLCASVGVRLSLLGPADTRRVTMSVDQQVLDVNRLYRIDEAATFLSVGRSTVYHLIREGRLRSVHIATAHRVSGAAIAALARVDEPEPAADADADRPGGVRIALPELDRLIESEGIVCQRVEDAVLISRRGLEEYLRGGAGGGEAA